MELVSDLIRIGMDYMEFVRIIRISGIFLILLEFFWIIWNYLGFVEIMVELFWNYPKII